MHNRVRYALLLEVAWCKVCWSHRKDESWLYHDKTNGRHSPLMCTWLAVRIQDKENHHSYTVHWIANNSGDKGGVKIVTTSDLKSGYIGSALGGYSKRYWTKTSWTTNEQADTQGAEMSDDAGQRGHLTKWLLLQLTTPSIHHWRFNQYPFE